jgi:hypothetical protein
MSATPSNVVLAKDGARVTIDTTGVEESWIKNLTTFNVPKPTAQQSITEGENDTKIIDLLIKTEKRFTITGHLVTDTAGTDGDKSSTGAAITDAKDKRAALKAIFFAGMANQSVVTLTYEGDTYDVALEKTTVNWVANDESPITIYDVTITCISGVAL